MPIDAGYGLKQDQSDSGAVESDGRPNGGRVVNVLRTVDRGGNRDARSLWQIRAGGEPVRYWLFRTVTS
ncbi:hypothetical protein [Nocardia terpenica]|uniref:Uncharacterized protein n=1 Tax=Nocardia terpenica TaxID=455432 RepID=A0A291RJ00_9NOCA|nr:hypothetical protein [Nocardia terpenica]ATL67270.1 hypothetical protein CRH09_14775 [Nocardia terpenica]